MKTLRMDEIRPGMAVAADVRNTAGGILVGEGTTLSDTHIRRLKIAGIEMVSITDAESAPKPPETSPDARLEALAARFEGVAEPALLQIKEAVAARLAAMMPKTAQ